MDPIDATSTALKVAARADARAVRRAIPAEARAEKAVRISERFLALPELRATGALGCYVGVRSEVATERILRGLLAKRVVVAVPAVVNDRLRFVRLDHPWALAAGAYGIPEPRQPWTEVDGDRLSVVVVPGLRFGRDGSRLGNGGGHFDRFLAAHPAARRVALAFTEQLVDRVPVAEHDQHMDVIVTEAEVVRAPRPPPA